MTAEVPILLVDTVTRLEAAHAGAVIVTGSHGGEIAARYAAAARVRAIVVNDAGVGCDGAGIAGLASLDAVRIAGCAIAHDSARIADAADSWARGVVSHVNAVAGALGVRRRMSARDAAGCLRAAPGAQGTLPSPHEARHVLVPARAATPAVIGLDSIGSLQPDDAGTILVIGSHGALHGGDPASALPVDARAAFFHDAGRGRDDAGTSRLPVLDRRRVPAATVDHRSARIGDARSMFATGELSCVNPTLQRAGVRVGMSVGDAVAALLAGR